MLMQPGVSIVVCCYNSADRLPETLEHIAHQKVEDCILWEVIIVNNHSSDNTVEVARNLWDTYGCTAPFRIVDEPKSGLSHAREKGFAEALYQYVLFCDDDNWLDQNYVQIASEIMSANPQVGVLGGQGEAVCAVEPPEWFEKYKSIYAVGKQAEKSEDVTDSRGYVYGAGTVVNRAAWSVLKRKGFQYFLTDRKNKSLSSGGDSEFCAAARLVGFRIFYAETLKFKHFIPEERLCWNYCRKMFKGFAGAAIPLQVYNYVFETRTLGSFEELKQQLKSGLTHDIKSLTSSIKRLLFYSFSDLIGEYYITNYDYQLFKRLCLALGWLDSHKLVKHTGERRKKLVTF